MKKRLVIIILLVFIGGGGFLTGLLTGWGILFPKTKPPQDVLTNLLWETYAKLKDTYIAPDELSDEKLLYGAIRGLVEASGDPYSAFFTPQEARQFLEDTSGHFDGIGAEIGYRDHILTVIAPLPQSPAEHMGLKPDDMILSIDGKATDNMTLEEAVSLIRGPAGSTVELQIASPEDEKPRALQITRARIEIPSLEVERKGDFAVMKLFNFSEDAPERFRTEGNALASNMPKGIVLDMRNNPGGFLSAAVDIAGWFLPQGSPVVIEHQRGVTDTTDATNGPSTFADLPIVVLVNEGTASAAEILAGALLDDRGIPLVGKKTFGKGTIQEFPTLSGGAALKVTVGEWLTPKGISLRRGGLKPTFEISDDPKTKDDEALLAALNILQEDSR